MKLNIFNKEQDFINNIKNYLNDKYRIIIYFNTTKDAEDIFKSLKVYDNSQSLKFIKKLDKDKEEEDEKRDEDYYIAVKNNEDKINLPLIKFTLLKQKENEKPNFIDYLIYNDRIETNNIQEYNFCIIPISNPKQSDIIELINKHLERIDKEKTDDNDDEIIENMKNLIIYSSKEKIEQYLHYKEQVILKIQKRFSYCNIVEK